MSISLWATRWRPTGSGISASCTAVQLFASADNGYPHNALRYH